MDFSLLSVSLYQFLFTLIYCLSDCLYDPIYTFTSCLSNPSESPSSPMPNALVSLSRSGRGGVTNGAGKRSD
ncbi:hypothetical protein F5879DRAFT_549305 [Lentinula edodes]|nr:hypothetical protein F5879DRAFT_549305 [Lentinula edodes]